MLLWRRGALGNLYTPEYRVLWVVYLLALQSWYVSWYVVCTMGRVPACSAELVRELVRGMYDTYISIGYRHRDGVRYDIDKQKLLVRAGSSINPQISSATNAACISNSNVTFRIKLTAMNS